MEKQWIKFTKAYTDPDGTAFDKDAIVEVTKSVADSLILLSMAEVTDAPKEANKSLDLTEVTKNLTSTIQDVVKKEMAAAVTSGFDDVNTTFEKHLNIDVSHEFSPAELFEKGVQQKYGKDWQNKYWSEVLKGSKPNSGGKIFGDEEFTKVPDPQGINTLDDQEGGFLVPETISNEIWTGMMKDTEAFLPKTDQRFTSGNNLTSLRMTESTRAAGVRHGGVQAYWTDEAELFTKSQPKWDKLNMYLHKITALVYVTDEELADANHAVVPVIGKLAPEAINFLVQQSMISGTGVGKPQGILKADALGVVARTATTGTVSHIDMTKMYHTMLPNLRAGAEWLVHPNFYEQLEFMTFNDATAVGNPIFFPNGSFGGTGQTASPLGTMKGLPVRVSEFCTDLDDFGDVILVNWSQYRTLQKVGGGIKSAVSMHVRFLYEEKAFRFSFRVGGQHLWSSGQTDLNGSTVRHPVVTLAGLSGTSGL